MTTPTASEIRTRTAALVSIAALFVLLTGSVHAQNPAVSDAELRDLRSEVRPTAVSTSAPVEAFTTEELRDLRAEIRPRITEQHGSGGGFTDRELRDLRAETRSVPGPSWASVEAFTEAELHALRSIAHQQGVAAETGTFEATR